jgi:hypothetical protein
MDFAAHCVYCLGKETLDIFEVREVAFDRPHRDTKRLDLLLRGAVRCRAGTLDQTNAGARLCKRYGACRADTCSARRKLATPFPCRNSDAFTRRTACTAGQKNILAGQVEQLFRGDARGRIHCEMASRPDRHTGL